MSFGLWRHCPRKQAIQYTQGLEMKGKDHPDLCPAVAI
jgi:hypothetical protein